MQTNKRSQGESSPLSQHPHRGRRQAPNKVQPAASNANFCKHPLRPDQAKIPHVKTVQCPKSILKRRPFSEPQRCDLNVHERRNISGKGEMTVVRVAMFKANARAMHAASAGLSDEGRLAISPSIFGAKSPRRAFRLMKASKHFTNSSVLRRSSWGQSLATRTNPSVFQALLTQCIDRCTRAKQTEKRTARAAAPLVGPMMPRPRPQCLQK